MPIAGANLPFLAFLDELYIDCLDSERAIKKLRDGARHWRLMATGRDFDRKFPPGEIMAWASVCLGSFNQIRLMLFPGSRRASAVKKRCALLQEMLGHPPLEHVCSPEVRNGWEHLDERLDSIVMSPTFKRFSHYSISADVPHPDTLVFRCLDPKTLTIRFLDQEVPLRPCLNEIRGLKAAIVRTHDSLLDGRIIQMGT